MPTESAPSIPPHHPRTWIRPYYRSFNGIRGLAVLMVFFSHFIWMVKFGRIPLIERFLFVGVDLFFVLSGFLITGILFDSLEDPHYFRNFYVRRALRIFPLFYGIFLLLLILTPLMHLAYHADMLFGALYIENLTRPWLVFNQTYPMQIVLLHHGSRSTVAALGHFWTLCVEEQFYLIWPAVVWFVRDRLTLQRI
jgi:peptidoglycan/LPS O-acetylase OafA/YrhL